MTLLLQTPTRSTQSAAMGVQSLLRYPPSPTSTNDTEPETEAELFFPDGQDDLEIAYGTYGDARGFGYGTRGANAMTATMTGLQPLQNLQACNFALSTNPPKAKTGFRHGDWM